MEQKINSIRPTPELIKSIADILNEIFGESNTPETDVNLKIKKALIQTDTLAAVFTAKKPPSVSILSYLERIVKYSKMEESTLIVTLILIDRLCELNGIKLDKLNIHRIIMTCSVLAVKYNEDDYYSNEFYAKVGGINLSEMNNLEYNCVILLNHNLFVKDEIFFKYQVYLKNYPR